MLDDRRPDQPEAEVIRLPTARAALDELYVQAGELPQIRQAEGSWISSIAAVAIACAAVVAILETLGYW